MRRLCWVVLIFLLLVTLASAAQSAPRVQAAPLALVQITDPQEAYDFGVSITFSARLHADEAVESVVLFYQTQNDTRTGLGLATLTPQADGTSRLSYTQDLKDAPPRAFAWIEYRWEVRLQSGETYTSPPARFLYRDNRFAWNMLEEKPFRVYWYDGNLSFAQGVLDAAQEGMLQVQNLLPLPMPTSLDIYIYADSATLQEALHPNSPEWVAGHADPDLGLIVAALPPGPEQNILVKQRIPHELMHVLLYQATDLGYANLPTWLNEGLASLAELYPNSDYALLLDDAVYRSALLPMAGLCQTFPRDASNALLAYAQSASFVRHLHAAHGTTGLQSLITTYANGLGCEQGAQRALGRSLTQLERDWRRESLAVDTTTIAANNLLPWLVLLLAALAAPLGILLRRSLLAVRRA